MLLFIVNYSINKVKIQRGDDFENRFKYTNEKH